MVAVVCAVWNDRGCRWRRVGHCHPAGPQPAGPSPARLQHLSGGWPSKTRPAAACRAGQAHRRRRCRPPPPPPGLARFAKRPCTPPRARCCLQLQSVGPAAYTSGCGCWGASAQLLVACSRTVRLRPRPRLVQGRRCTPGTHPHATQTLVHPKQPAWWGPHTASRAALPAALPRNAGSCRSRHPRRAGARPPLVFGRPAPTWHGVLPSSGSVLHQRADLADWAFGGRSAAVHAHHPPASPPDSPPPRRRPARLPRRQTHQPGRACGSLGGRAAALLPGSAA